MQKRAPQLSHTYRAMFGQLPHSSLLTSCSRFPLLLFSAKGMCNYARPFHTFRALPTNALIVGLVLVAGIAVPARVCWCEFLSAIRAGVVARIPLLIRPVSEVFQELLKGRACLVVGGTLDGHYLCLYLPPHHKERDQQNRECRGQLESLADLVRIRDEEREYVYQG